MTRLYSRSEVVALVPGLDEARLEAVLAARLLVPLATAAGPRFREADLARLQLVCDLDDAIERHDEAVGVVLSLVDEVACLRGDLRALVKALAQEPPELRARLRAQLAARRAEDMP